MLPSYWPEDVIVRDDKSLSRRHHKYFNWFSFYRHLGLDVFLLFEKQKDPTADWLRPFPSAAVTTTLKSGCCSSPAAALYLHEPGRLWAHGGCSPQKGSVTPTPHPPHPPKLRKLGTGKLRGNGQMQTRYCRLFNRVCVRWARYK